MIRRRAFEASPMCSTGSASERSTTRFTLVFVDSTNTSITASMRSCFTVQSTRCRFRHSCSSSSVHSLLAPSVSMNEGCRICRRLSRAYCSIVA